MLCLTDLGFGIGLGLLLAACEARQSNAVVATKLDPITVDPGATKQKPSPRTKHLPSSGAKKRAQTQAASASETPDAFASPNDCLTLMRNGNRAPREAGTVRVGAWNVRWFPDGIPGSTPKPSRATDLDWLACTLAWMNVDAVALAEIKPRSRSEAALAHVLTRLDELTGGKHHVRLDDCPDQNGQHVAWLVDANRVDVSEWTTHASINPHGDACSGQLRPGLGAKMRFTGGLDLHAVAVHLKSGVEPRDLALRRTSFDGLERVIASVTRRSGDADVLIAGDFNSMGCRSCGETTRSAAEASWLDTRLRAYRPEARRVPSDLGCSLYFQRQPSLLDHFVVTTAMQEARREQSATVYGHCRRLGCDAYSGSDPAALSHLSDHCPIVLTLVDEDLD